MSASVAGSLTEMIRIEEQCGLMVSPVEAAWSRLLTALLALWPGASLLVSV